MTSRCPSLPLRINDLKNEPAIAGRHAFVSNYLADRKRIESIRTVIAMPTEYQHPDSIVSSAWLAEHLHDPELRVFECTTYLDHLPLGGDAPYRVVSGRADYEQGHIAGAGFLDIQNELSDTGSASHLKFTMLPPERLAEVLGRRGVGDGRRVVLYSRNRNVWATTFRFHSVLID